MNIHAICVVALKAEPCAFCGVRPGAPCTGGRPGVHLCRICAAVEHHLLTMLDEVSVISDRDAYTGSAFIIDEVA